MSLTPKKFREIVLQLLFSFEMGGDEKDDLISVLMHEVKVSHTILLQAYERADQIWKKKDEIDREISSISYSYDFKRIGQVEKSVLRLGVFELLEKILPMAIIIDEAIRLTSKFSSKEGALFVNAILAKFSHIQSYVTQISSEQTAIEQSLISGDTVSQSEDFRASFPS